MQGRAGQGGQGSAGQRKSRQGMAMMGKADQGRKGKARRSKTWVGQRKAGQAKTDKAGQRAKRQSMAAHGYDSRAGEEGQGRGDYGMAEQRKSRQIRATRDNAVRGEEVQDRVWRRRMAHCKW